MTIKFTRPVKTLRLAMAGLVAGLSLTAAVSAQDATAAGAKALDHTLGTVTSVDKPAHTMVVKDDKTGVEEMILLEKTKTLLKVPPQAKDLKTATRITADDLQAGDRVDVRGTKLPDNPNSLAAKSVVLMSARELAAAHQTEAAAWQHATGGIVTSVDSSAGKIMVTAKAANGQQPLTVSTSTTTQFLRYSPDAPKTPASSQLSEIQPGDLVRVLGDKSDDGSSITATKLYSGPFRTIGGTVASIAADGKSIVIKTGSSKQTVEIALNDDSVIRRLLPPMAMMLAVRLNPSYKPPSGAAGGYNGRSGSAGSGAVAGTNASLAPSASPQAGPSGWPGAPAGEATAPSDGTRPGGGLRRGGDPAQVIEHAPKIAVTDLKLGDAVLVSGAATKADDSRIVATNVIAGAEAILQAAPSRKGGQVSMGDWGLSGSVPGGEGGQ